MQKQEISAKGLNQTKPKKKLFKGFTLSAGFISRMRWVLFTTAILLLFIAFQMGDDWFVREFANYDWARSIGF